MPFFAFWKLHSHFLFAHLRKSTQNTSKVRKYFSEKKRDVQITRGGRQPSPGFIPRLFGVVAPRQGLYWASPGFARLDRVGALFFLQLFYTSI